MIRMVNRLNGGTMWVSDDRVEEYLELGHTLPPPPVPLHPIRREKAPEPEVSGPDTKAKTTRKRK